MLHPGADGGEYQIIVRFTDGVRLRDWERSAIRNELMERSDQFVTGMRMQRTVGVEEWFNSAGLAEPKRPLWKKMSIDVAWVYPAALFFSIVLAPLLVKTPKDLRADQHRGGDHRDALHRHAPPQTPAGQTPLLTPDAAEVRNFTRTSCVELTHFPSRPAIRVGNGAAGR